LIKKKINLLDWDNSTKKLKKNHETQFPNNLILKNKIEEKIELLEGEIEKKILN